MTTRTSMLNLLLIFMASVILAADPAWAGSTTPSPVKALEKEGLSIAGHFNAPGGLTGYAATYQGHPVAIYVTPDGRHAIVGTMVDSHGRNLSAAPLRRLVSSPKYQKAWGKLKNSTWVADGSNKAKRIVYMFTDANCPYCHKFWQASRPWVRAGKVQIRHIIVAILRPSSLPKAAAILSASNPTAALARDEKNYNSGGIKPAQHVQAAIMKKIQANNQLMSSLGFRATPTIFYRNKKGHVAVKEGLPQGQELIKIMGSSKP